MNPFSADRLLQITIELSAEKDISLLLDRILTAAIDLTRCDAGTIYIREEDQLVFHNMITRSKGLHLIRGRAAKCLRRCPFPAPTCAPAPRWRKS